jgi:transposase
MAIEDDIRGHIRFLYFKEEYRISKIAQKTGVSRKTIRDIIRDKPLAENRQCPSQLDPFKEQIQSILAKTPDQSTTLILESLYAAGYKGGKTIVYDYVSRFRKSQREVFMRLSSLPGEQAQVDWGHCDTISCGVHSRKLYCFCMTLSWSRYLYLEFTVSMDMNTFLLCHRHAFNFFGGVPKTIVYDNLKSVVLFHHGKEISFNARHFDFAQHYEFSPKACNVRKANEKGKVERIIQYVKGNFLKRGPFENFEHLKLESKNWLVQIANKRLHSVTRKVPEQVFRLEEQPCLLKLPAIDYDCFAPEPAVVSKESLITFQTNKYSVPSDYAYQTVTLKATSSQVIIYSQNKPIATHRRCYDKYQLIQNPEHFKKLAAQKAQVQRQLTIEKFKKLSAETPAYLSGLAQHQNNVLFHVKKIFELISLFGQTAVCGALAKALEHQAFNWEHIKNIVLDSHWVDYQPPITTRCDTPILEIDVETPDLAKYDEVSHHE